MNALRLILAVILLPGAHPFGDPPERTDPPSAAILRHLASAETLQVFRLGVEDPLGHGSWNWAQPGWLAGHRIVSEGHVDRVWQARMAAMLSDPAHYRPRIVEPAGPDDFARFGLRFSGHGRTTDVVFFPGTRCWSVWPEGSPESVGYFGGDANEILRLLCSALRADPVVRRLSPDGRLDPRDLEPASPHGTYLARMPEVVRSFAAEYPRSAHDAGIEGTVILQATIGRDGKVRRVNVMRSVPGLDGAALAAVRMWYFRPALDAVGRPVECLMAIPVAFSLH